MNVAVAGTGYVGLVTAVCLADKGHKVVCVDIDQEKIDALHLTGKSLLYEKNLDELLRSNHDADLCFIFTEWPEIKECRAEIFKRFMKTPIIIDGRNCYELETMKGQGIVYESIGRGTVQS